MSFKSSVGIKALKKYNPVKKKQKNNFNHNAASLLSFLFWSIDWSICIFKKEYILKKSVAFAAMLINNSSNDLNHVPKMFACAGNQFILCT